MAACGTWDKFLAEVRKGQENGTNFFLVPAKNLIGRFSFNLQGMPLRPTSSPPFYRRGSRDSARKRHCAQHTGDCEAR